jgi:tetratricopeptide (TPR) repeat protein
MEEERREARAFQNERVAFAGRLASLTATDAATLVQAHGGRCVPRVTRSTTLLVVGQDGLPLRRDGRLNSQLEKAQSLRRNGCLTILTEAEFLTRLGKDTGAGHQHLTTAQLCQVLQVTGRRIRSWVRLGLIQPRETNDGVHYFDFQQVSRAKTLWNLVRAGVRPERIRRSLEQLHEWLPEASDTLAILEADGQLLVRLGEGRLAEPSGQGLFDFEREASPEVMSVTTDSQSAEEWFQTGCDHEEAGRWEEAARAYQTALLVGGPDANACFNLGNVLYAMEEHGRAAERFRQAVEMEPRWPEAWNNLGNALANLKQADDAQAAFEKALKLSPGYADAHRNLAIVLEEVGRRQEAQKHWRAAGKANSR